MKAALLLAFLMAVYPHAPVAETSGYEITLFGNKIGTMNITRNIAADGSENYVLDSYTKAKVLWIDKEIVSHMETVYRAGKLVSSFYKEVENGKLTRWNRVTLAGNVYNVDGYKGKRTFTEAPQHSVVHVYFNDLTKVNRIFDEGEAEFVTFEHPDATTWQFKTEKSTNVFHTLNGHVHDVEFHASIATVKMMKVN